MARGIVDWVGKHDPDGTALRNAAKVAVAVTVGLAIGTLLGNAQMSLFASFGGVALLLFADFPGGRTARLGAYLGLYLAGLVLIALGTLASPVPWVATAGMFAIGFAILLSGVLSAAIAGAARAALLAFILPVMVPVPIAEIGSRWAGWTLAAVLSIPAAVFLWPPREHDRLRAHAGTACVALADQLAAWAAVADRTTRDAAHQATGEAIAALQNQFRRTNVRPVGLTSGSRQLIRLADRLEWLRTVIDHLPDTPDRTPGQLAVTDAAERTLRSAAAVLAEATRRPSFATRQALSVDLRALHQLHVATDTFGALVERGPVDPVLHPSTMLEVAYTTRLTGLTVAAAAAADARPLVDRLLGRQAPAAAGRVLPVYRVLGGHLTVRSVWFQNSLRGALGLAIAVAIAEITDVAHGFWVVLGAMSVLRTTAMNTGSTALRAIGGTVVGFAVGAVIMLAVGTTPWHLWLLLPVTVLIAAYLPAAVSFAAGQAAFTVMVVVLFNIVSPSGWLVGLVRVEDILFGCVSALVSGLLLWPHGAAAAIRTALAEYYRRTADAVAVATDRLAGAAGADQDTLRAALLGAATASLRFDDALREYLFERGTRNVPLPALTRLSNGAGRIRMTAEAIADLPTTTGPPAHAPGALIGSAHAVQDWFAHLADQLEPGHRDGAPLPDPVGPVAEPAVLADTKRAIGERPEAADELLAAGRTLWVAALYLDNLGSVQGRLRAPADEIAGRAPTPGHGAQLAGAEPAG